MTTRFVDEINRLFDQLVRDPWRPSVVPAAVEKGSAGQWEVDIPVTDGDREDVAVFTEGQRLTISVHRRGKRVEATAGGDVVKDTEERFRQSFLMPEDTELSGVETRFEPGHIHLRISVRRRVSRP